jgi:hypothetical protein
MLESVLFVSKMHENYYIRELKKKVLSKKKENPNS